MMMKVNPRLSHTVASATEGSAHVVFWRKLIGSWPMALRNWLTIPIDGLSRVSHMSEATATDVAIVEENMVRNTAMPRSRWWASTARARPAARPRGTVRRVKGRWPEAAQELRRGEHVGVLGDADPGLSPKMFTS
jgi:hypothetical protein